MLETLESKPGLEVSTHLGKCVLLYPERAGHPEGNWIGVLEDGYAITLTQSVLAECTHQEEINASATID